MLLKIELSRGVDHINWLNWPHFCTCPQRGPGFLMPCVVVFFMFNDCSCSFC